MTTAYIFGYKSYWDGEVWRFLDTNEEAEHSTRKCPKCKKPPTKEGYDPCLGKLKGVTAACCGHGVKKKIIIYDLP